MKTVTALIAASMLFAVTAPVFAADAAPTTKDACKKMTDMKWDAKTKSCVKK